MKFKKQRDEGERLERVAKIKAHLAAKTSPVTPKADTQAEPQAETTVAPKASSTRIYPPLRPWEKVGAFGRREQFRRMTARELEQENDRIFMESQKRQDDAHAKRVAAFEREQAAEEKAARKRAEHEARTGTRPYEPGRYCSVDEAIRRGYVGNEPSEQRADEWSSPGNPQGLMGGGRR